MLHVMLLVIAGPHEYTITAAPGADIAPLIQGAIDSCEASPPIDDQSVGCLIDLPAGAYQLSHKIVLCRQHTIRGKGGGGWGSRTRLTSLVTAFRLGRSECAGKGNGAAWSEIEDLGIVLLTPAATSTPAYGIDAESRFRARNVWIRGGTIGVRVDADKAAGGNANSWHINDVLIENTAHAGVMVRGGDTNVGLGNLVSVVGSCRRASRWTSRFGPCSAVVDRSFLGSSWVSVHTAASRDLDTLVYQPGISMLGDSQRSICVGCYSEVGQAPARMDKFDIALGGLATWQGTYVGHGLRVEGPFLSGLSLRNTKDAANPVELRLGDLAASGTLLDMVASAVDSRPLRIKADRTRRLFLVDFANTLRISAWGVDGKWYSAPSAGAP
jgi:hypothetical protein